MRQTRPLPPYPCDASREYQRRKPRLTLIAFSGSSAHTPGLFPDRGPQKNSLLCTVSAGSIAFGKLTLPQARPCRALAGARLTFSPAPQRESRHGHLTQGGLTVLPATALQWFGKDLCDTRFWSMPWARPAIDGVVPIPFPGKVASPAQKHPIAAPAFLGGAA